MTMQGLGSEGVRVTRRRPVPGWTEVGQLTAVLRRRWDTGQYLKGYAARESWQPVDLPVKGPSASELLDRLDEARRWLLRFERDARPFGIEYRIVQGRHLGANRIPARVRVDSFEQLCRILETESQVRRLDELLEHTRDRLPGAQAWAIANPLVVLRNESIWDRALEVVRWIASHQTDRLYLRQVDVEGVDTKFVETNHRLLDELLTVVLPANRIDTDAASFAGRFRFLEKPQYTRFRLLDPEAFSGPFSELALRTDEFAATVPAATAIFIVENEVTYLAFPPLLGALVIFGSGFALSGLARLPWLLAKDVVYWGDIDTHGFAILDRLRARLRNVRSMLMDRETLLAHPHQWVTEPNPTRRSMPHLTSEEAFLYRDLVEGTYGGSVRLEQERIRFSILECALQPWTAYRA
jgi:hypothetical protein